MSGLYVFSGPMYALIVMSSWYHREHRVSELILEWLKSGNPTVDMLTTGVWDTNAGKIDHYKIIFFSYTTSGNY